MGRSHAFFGIEERASHTSQYCHHERADYGSHVIERLSKDLEINSTLIWRTVQFYEKFPILARRQESQSKALLNWSHYRALIAVPDSAQENDFAAATGRFPTAKQILVQGKITDHLRKELAERGKVARPVNGKERKLIFPGDGQIYAGLVANDQMDQAAITNGPLIPVTSTTEEDLDPLVAKYVITLQTAVAVLLAHQIKDEHQKKLILLNPAELLRNYNLIPTFENRIVRGTANGLEISTLAVRAYLEWKATERTKMAA